MFFVHDLELILLYLVIFMAGYFIYERLISWKKIVQWKVPSQAKDFISGTFYGALTLVIEMISKLIFYDFNLPLFVATALIVSNLKNYVSALYSIIIPITVWGLNQGGSNIAIEITISFFVTMLSLELLKWFEVNKLIFFAFVTIFVALINFLITGFAWDYTLKTAFDQSSVIYIFVPLLVFVVSWFIKFSISSRVLFESTNFKYDGYYRSGLAQKAFEDFVKNNKTKHALFCAIKLNFNQKMNDNQNEEIVKTHLETLRKSLGLNNFYFSMSKNYYGVVIPYEGKVSIKKTIEGNKKELREEDDMLYELQLKLKLIPSIIKTSWEESVLMNSKVGVSLYGNGNASFEKLLSNASYAVESHSSKNVVSLYDHKELSSIKQDYRMISQMDKNITLDDYALTFIPIYNANKKETAFTYAEVRNVSEFDYYESIDEIVYSKGWETIFNRYFAAEALKKAEGKKIGFDYSLTIFEDNFDIEHFKSFVKVTNSKLENLYLFINKESIRQAKNIKRIKEAIDELQGINFVIDNDADQQKTLKIFDKVNMVFVQSENYELNFEGASVVNYSINSEDKIKKSYKNGITFLGGDAIENKIIFTKLDKQSKIYLESILKERR